ncbi:MAG: hypothetical protein M1821_003188 [Bathelium mastoideum]|nr:MAG: hypothetical protein M1821_003188 [Bathelium mastoideum]
MALPEPEEQRHTQTASNLTPLHVSKPSSSHVTPTSGTNGFPASQNRREREKKAQKIYGAVNGTTSGTPTTPSQYPRLSRPSQTRLSGLSDVQDNDFASITVDKTLSSTLASRAHPFELPSRSNSKIRLPSEHAVTNQASASNSVGQDIRRKEQWLHVLGRSKVNNSVECRKRPLSSLKQPDSSQPLLNSNDESRTSGTKSNLQDREYRSPAQAKLATPTKSGSVSSSSSESNRASDTTDLLWSFQHGSESDEPAHKKPRLMSDSSRALTLTGGKKEAAVQSKFLQLKAPNALEKHSLSFGAPHGPTQGGKLAGLSPSAAPRSASEQNLPTPRLIQRFSSEKAFKVPPTFEDEDPLYAAASLNLTPKKVESSRSQIRTKEEDRKAGNAKKAPLPKETTSTLISGSKPSDFPDKESAAFKAFLEQRMKAKNHKEASRKRLPWDENEDDLLNYLKGDCDHPWSFISKFFPGRTKETMQVRWSTKLKPYHPSTRNGTQPNETLATGPSWPATRLSRPATRLANRSRSKRYDRYNPDFETDEDSRSTRSSASAERLFKDTQSSSDADDNLLQSFKVSGEHGDAAENSSDSAQTSSVDSLLGSSDGKGHHAKRLSNVIPSQDRRTGNIDSGATNDNNQQITSLAGTDGSLIEILTRTQLQIEKEKARRRCIPRRRASNRPLYLRQRDLSSESSDNSHAHYSSQSQITRTSGYRVPASLTGLQRVPGKAYDHPYLDFTERRILENGVEADWDRDGCATWEGVTLHMDFTDSELHELKNCLKAATDVNIKTKLSLREQLRDAGRQMDQGDIAIVASLASRRSALRHRTNASIRAFLQDLFRGTTSKTSTRRRIGPLVPRSSGFGRSGIVSSLLLDRELGTHTRRKSHVQGSVHPNLQTQMLDTLGPSCSFTGTSGDVHTVAWAPGGNFFAAGSVATTDENSMQYNRPNNLLLGDADKHVLRGLPGHTTERPRIEKGVNATEAMRVTQDPRLFMTVAMVDFSRDGNFMFSAGYDDFVCMWDIGSELNSATCSRRWRHRAPVDVIAVGEHGVLATGSRRTDNSIKVFNYGLDTAETCSSFTSNRAKQKPDTMITPSCLKWGVHGHHSKYLLAGFASGTPEGKLDAYGETCLWDVGAEQQLSFIKNTPGVFECAWNPIPSRRASFFAIASAAPPQGVNKGTHSIVRLYDPATPMWDKYRCTDELECPAYDMNEILWCPNDENLIAASCTNGKTYLWDIRTSKLLGNLKHGDSLMPLDDSQPPELVDTGVRFSSWGPCRDRFYTGSSDGLVSAWNPYVAPEDMHVRDLVKLNSGVMCGAFSPDYTRLLVGEVNGSVNLLSVGEDERTVRDMAKFKIQPSTMSAAYESSEDSEDGFSPAKNAAELVKSGAVTLKPMGSFPIRQAVQGPKYEASGLKDKADDAVILRAKAKRFQANLLKSTGNSEEPCQLHDAESLYRFTEAELKDSRRSLDRIPHSLRSAVRAPPISEAEPRTGVVAAKKTCSRCGRAARPRLDCDSDNETAYCEVCSFTCLRCSAPAVLWHKADTVECSACGVTWRADILGYTVEVGRSNTRMRDRISKHDTRVKKYARDDETDDETDDELHRRWLATVGSP